MDIQRLVSHVWQNSEILGIPEVVKQRKYCFCANDKQKDILVLGLNPTYNDSSIPGPVKFTYRKNPTTEYKYNPYFTRVTDMLQSADSQLDFAPHIAYTDLFYHRENNSLDLLQVLLDDLDGRIFLIDQLNVTQKLIEEVIKPKVIIASNWTVALFMGFYGMNADSPWYGYDFEFVEYTKSGHKVYQIKGIVTDDALMDDFVKTTNLVGTYFICNPYLSSGEFSANTLTAEDIAVYCKDLNQQIEREETFNEIQSGLFDDLYDVIVCASFPDLYIGYFDTGEAEQEEHRPEDIALLKKLLLFRDLPVPEVAKYIFADLANEKVLKEQDISELSSATFCADVLWNDTLAIKEVTGLQEADIIALSADFFAEPIELLADRWFVISKHWDEFMLNPLEEWFVGKVYVERG